MEWFFLCCCKVIWILINESQTAWLNLSEKANIFHKRKILSSPNPILDLVFVSKQLKHCLNHPLLKLDFRYEWKKGEGRGQERRWEREIKKQSLQRASPASPRPGASLPFLLLCSSRPQSAVSPHPHVPRQVSRCPKPCYNSATWYRVTKRDLPEGNQRLWL